MYEDRKSYGRVQVENVSFLPALESFFQSVTVQSSSCEELVDHQKVFLQSVWSRVQVVVLLVTVC